MIYFKCCVLVVIFVGIFGALLPQLISSRNDVNVMMGVFIAMCATPCLYLMAKNIVKPYLKPKEEK